MSNTAPTKIAFQTEEVTRVTRHYEVELTPEQAEQFEALKDDPEAQQVYLMGSIEEGDAKLTEEEQVEHVASVTQYQAGEDEPRKVASQEFRQQAGKINDQAQITYGHEIKFTEMDPHLGPISSEQTIYAGSYKEALTDFVEQMDSESRELLRVFPPPLPDSEIPKWIQHEDGVTELVPLDGEEHTLKINQYSTLEIQMPDAPDESINLAVRVGDEIVGHMEVTPEMLSEAQRMSGSHGMSPG
ncbi:hypothetical protein EZI54_07140 [Marinobacter halodurans]|uniref:Uncharacterized protein n=1 Tax=Marinobacter halodurans TaxID=2528979 RepID=A0ABY1ZRI3_9GAMM|nr:hypothetical protein [Marinobacter halodurans]TBW57426.1 hypothetical protein EZI54_07140 [Marinobacter halodurans]